MKYYIEDNEDTRDRISFECVGSNVSIRSNVPYYLQVTKDELIEVMCEMLGLEKKA